MKRLFLAATALLAIWGLTWIPQAKADTIEDPLHGTVCSGAGTGCVNLDNGSFVPFTQSNFGFEISGPISPATGSLQIVVGVPTDEINTGTFLLPLLTDNGGTGNTVNVFSRVNLFNALSASGTGVLSTYLGEGSFSPTDNFSNLSAGTLGVDPTFGGNFLVFTLTLPNILLDSQGSTTLTNDFMFGANLPAGTFITGLFTIEASECSNNCAIGTAASSHLVVTPLSAVPGPIVGAGIPGLIALFSGGGGMLWLNRLRRKRNGVIA